MKPPREAYVRATVELAGVEVITGVELRPDDSFDELLSLSKLVSLGAYEAARADGRSSNVTRLACYVENALIARFPDRAYFIEVCGGTERDGWVQIFQPWEKS